MASKLTKNGLQTICFRSRTCRFSSHSRIVSDQILIVPNPHLRHHIHTSSGRHARAPTQPTESAKPKFEFSLTALPPDKQAAYSALSETDQAAWRVQAEEIHAFVHSDDMARTIQAQVAEHSKLTRQLIPAEEKPRPVRLKGFLHADEEKADAEEIGDDPVFDGDDITSMAHGDLEQHREMREYARMAVWDLPLLCHLRKPFVPPTPAQFLRFRQTTYMGETHPAGTKVVMEFSTRSLARERNLTATQQAKFIKLVGTRYNPSTDVVKMSCEKFEQAAQNKAHLRTLLNGLVAEVKDVTTDTFADVPFDFRHWRAPVVKRRLNFPDEWKLTPVKREALLQKRTKAVEEDKGVVAGAEIVAVALKRVEGVVAGVGAGVANGPSGAPGKARDVAGSKGKKIA